MNDKAKNAQIAFPVSYDDTETYRVNPLLVRHKTQLKNTIDDKLAKLRDQQGIKE